MKVYDAATIRNVALVGHTGSGKTQLASAILADCGNGQPVRQGRRRHDRHRFRRRRNRAQAHAVGQPRLRRVEQAQNQSDRHARHGQFPERCARGIAGRRRGARRRRRRGRRHGADREGVGNGAGPGSAASDRGEPSRPRAREPRALAAIAARGVQPRPSCRFSCRSAKRRSFRGVVDLDHPQGLRSSRPTKAASSRKRRCRRISSTRSTRRARR